MCLWKEVSSADSADEKTEQLQTEGRGVEQEASTEAVIKFRI